MIDHRAQDKQDKNQQRDVIIWNSLLENVIEVSILTLQRKLDMYGNENIARVWDKIIEIQLSG